MSVNEPEFRPLTSRDPVGALAERRRVEDELRQITELLRTQSERLRITLASIADAVITTDRDGRIASLNPVAETLTGWCEAEALGKGVEDVFRALSEESREPIPNPALLALQRGRPSDKVDPALLISKDGVERAIDERTSLIQNDAGAVFGSVLVFRDVTEQRRSAAAAQHLAAGVASSDDAIITKDLNGIITTWNEGARRIFGYEADEVTGKSITILIPPERLDEEASILARLRKGVRVLPFETVRVDKAGRRLDISVTSSPIWSATGQIVGASKIARDVTPRKRVERINQFLAFASAVLVDSTDITEMLRGVARAAVPAFADLCAIDLLGADGVVTRVAMVQDDPSLQSLTDEILNNSPPMPTDRLGPANVFRTGESTWIRNVKEDFPAQASRSERHLDFLRQLAPRSYICCAVRANGRTTAALSFVTRQMGADYDELYMSAAEDLANRISIAMENANLVRTLRDSDKRKDEFLAMLAHELRNPLAPIRNAASIIRVGASGNQLLEGAAGVIERQVRHMTRLVDDLLDVGRVTSGKIILQWERADVTALVRAVLETHRPQAMEQRIQLDADLDRQPVLLTVDSTRFSQILSNLIDNAIKYTEPGGSIRVALARVDSMVEIRVRDTGIGIEHDMLDKIFELFTQAEGGRGRSHGGLGIGLMLVHRLVTMHGGTVVALSDGPGKGSEFVVRFPDG